MTSTTKVLYFLTGAAVGSLAAWFGVKKYYEKKYQTEREEMRDEYRKRGFTVLKEIDDIPDYDFSEEDRGEAFRKITELEYISDAEPSENNYINRYSQLDGNDENESVLDIYPLGGGGADANQPYEINSMLYGEYNHYTTHTLYLWKNGLVTDDEYVLLDDVMHYLGDSVIARMTRDGDVIAYVRNDDLQSDYEICVRDEDFEGDD